MEIRQLKGLGVCGTNCYIIVSDKGNAVLIDAPEGSEEILSSLGNASLKKIILTHGHFDHIFSAGEIAEKTAPGTGTGKCHCGSAFRTGEPFRKAPYDLPSGLPRPPLLRELSF